jgi:hypothetical protein
MIGTQNGDPSLLIQTEFCFRDDTTHHVTSTHYIQFQNLVNMQYECKYFIQELRMQPWEFKPLYAYSSHMQINFTSSFCLAHYALHFVALVYLQHLKRRVKGKYIALKTKLYINSKRFWRRCTMLWSNGFLDFFHRAKNKITIKITTFRKQVLLPFLGEKRGEGKNT